MSSSSLLTGAEWVTYFMSVAVNGQQGAEEHPKAFPH